MPVPEAKLTDRQAEVERIVAEHHKTHGYAPSVREVAMELGTAINGALRTLRALEAKGRLRHDTGVARSWRIVDRIEP